MIKAHLSNKLLLASFLSVIISSYANADVIEFDDYILTTMGFDNVDLSSFAGEAGSLTGEYFGTVELNGKRVLRDYAFSFYSQDGKSNLCFTDGFMQRIGIKKEELPKLDRTESHEIDGNKCYPVETLDSVSVEFNERTQILNIIIPQKYLRPVDPIWVPPSEREHGVPGFILDYSVIFDYMRFKYSQSKYSNTIVRSYGTTGFNIGRFRFRGDYQYISKVESDQDKFKWSQIYAFTDIGSLNSKLYVGEIYTRSNMFDTTRIKGISLYSDESMMPTYLRGYAPRITGVARTNAIVTIRQNGNMLKAVQVPAGPFSIDDLPSYVNGTVDVEIKEDDGETREYQEDISSVPFLTRNKQLRYSFNVGKLAPFYNKGSLDTKLVSTDASYGITDKISLLGGTQFTTNGDYKAISLGLGLNLEKLGAISFDYTRSKNSVMKTESGKKYSGNSYRFNYAKRFESNLSLNLAAYRFSSREYTSLGNYISYMQSGINSTFLEKTRFSVSLSQYITEIKASVSGSISKGTYWNRSNYTYYNLSMSKVLDSGPAQGTSFNVTLTQDRNGDSERKDNRIGFYVNIPLTIGNNRNSIQYSSLYSSRSKSIDQQASFYHYDYDTGNNYTVGVSTYNKRDFSGSIDYSINATYTGETGFGNAMAHGNYSKYSEGVRASFDGSVTITDYGPATHKKVNNGNSRLILYAGGPGVSIEGHDHDKSNLVGLIGLANINSYRNASYNIDNDRVPEDIEIRDGVVNIAVSDGAIAFRSLNAIAGKKGIMRIKMPDGTYPPFGAMVKRIDFEEQDVGMVADEGLTYLSGLNNDSKYSVTWSDSSCNLKIGNFDVDGINDITCYKD